MRAVLGLNAGSNLAHTCQAYGGSVLRGDTHAVLARQPLKMQVEVSMHLNVYAYGNMCPGVGRGGRQQATADFWMCTTAAAIR